MSDENDYRPLADLIRENLEAGTELEAETLGIRCIWNGHNIDGHADEVRDPLAFYWRIVSVPPKKITFEAKVRGTRSAPVIALEDSTFELGNEVVVTVEEKR